jgi:signal peptidase I
MSDTAAPKPEQTQVKETLVSIIIAFVLAFVFRAFVIEAFIIPTGSMGPTLMGAHERVTSPETGYTWPVGPWFGGQNPLPTQGTASQPMYVHDPMTGQELRLADQRRQAGDRILVFKYLYSVYDPRRFDVVVFKAPHELYAGVNYIKRLIGLPGDEVALVDGDVFVRRPPASETGASRGALGGGRTWSLPGWQIQRKGERVQRAVWQEVFSSQYEPLDPVGGYQSPWESAGGGGAVGGWKIAGQREYEYSGSGPTSLAWNLERWPVDDFYPFNETSDRRNPPTQSMRQELKFSVSDVALRCGVKPSGAGVKISGVLRARGQEFRADIDGTGVTLRMGALGAERPDKTHDAPAQWTTLGTGTLAQPLEPGRVTNLEFWHADQALWLFADGKLIAHGVYEWTPEERLHRSLGVNLEEVVKSDIATSRNSLALQMFYHPAEAIRWEISGGPVTMCRVGLDRDIHYESVRPFDPSHRPRATHPLNPMILGPDQFFVCGDNSPQSLDARLWPAPDPWVAATIDPTEGVVPRDLMIGRAFFVYFPSLVKGMWSGVPMPDFGRMRFIW